MDKVQELLATVKHPEINNSLVELGMIGEVTGDEHQVVVELKLPVPGIPIEGLLVSLISNTLKETVEEVQVQTSLMSPEEKARFLTLAEQNWAL